MTQAQLKAAAKAAREYRARHPAKAKQASKEWKARNPDWWKGRKYVQLLWAALVRDNANSKVFRDAGLTKDEWISQWINAALKATLENGETIAPIKSWSDFSKDDPNRVKAFLAPGNFKLVQK